MPSAGEQCHGLCVCRLGKHVQHTGRLKLETAFAQQRGIARERGGIAGDIRDTAQAQRPGLLAHRCRTRTWRVEHREAVPVAWEGCNPLDAEEIGALEAAVDDAIAPGIFARGIQVLRAALDAEHRCCAPREGHGEIADAAEKVEDLILGAGGQQFEHRGQQTSIDEAIRLGEIPGRERECRAFFG